MTKAEQKHLGRMREMIPHAPIRFTIDDEPFEFSPLPLGTLLIIERMKEDLNINESIMADCPILEWLFVCRQQTDVMRRIVALLTTKGNPSGKTAKSIAFLREHCSADDLCSLFIIGSMAQNLWLRDAGTDTPPVDLDGISEHDLWDKPFLELFKKS